MSKTSTPQLDPEVAVINDVYAALKQLEPEAQARVLRYVSEKLKLVVGPSESRTQVLRDEVDEQSSAVDLPADGGGAAEQDDLEGISPVARKWMTRNGLAAKQLAALFSLGVDEIDLVAKTVPGKNKKERMHNIFLLKGVAAYLGSGVARFSHEQMKEACLHYDAFDAANFAVNFKSLASEVSGSKEAGYSLNARGLSAATEMVKSLVGSAQ